MSKELSLSEIKDWKQFQSLVADCLRALPFDNPQVRDVEALTTGDGVDEGKDILLTFRMTDGIKPFDRKWIVQCKFHVGTVGKKEMALENLPTLLHAHAADGYLLVCKSSPSSYVTKLLEACNSKCLNQRKYHWWTGQDVLNIVRGKTALERNYFPSYYESTSQYVEMGKAAMGS